jgi:hypothetical protein
MREFLRDLLTGIQSRNQDRLEDEWQDGYEQSAQVCLGVLSKEIDELQRRLGNLPKEDQVVLSHLHELRSAMKEELQAGPSAPVSERDGHPRTSETLP